mgnify:CR=1 FL=1
MRDYVYIDVCLSSSFPTCLCIIVLQVTLFNIFNEFLGLAYDQFCSCKKVKKYFQKKKINKYDKFQKSK